jgi:hypothetical protein
VGRPDRPLFVLQLTIAHGQILAIEAIGDPARLRQLRLAVLAK